MNTNYNTAPDDELVTTSIRLSRAQLTDLKALAAAENRTASQQMRELIRRAKDQAAELKEAS